MFKLIGVALLAIFSVSAFGQNDPTRPLIAGQESAQAIKGQGKQLILQSIIKSTDKQQYKAIISGRLVEQGAKVLGFTVIKIEQRHVVLQSAENVKKLTLFNAPLINYK
ncbi:agglutinin biogenesis protein MshK [Colwellia sp. MEBiC06753]